MKQACISIIKISQNGVCVMLPLFLTFLTVAVACVRVCVWLKEDSQTCIMPLSTRVSIFPEGLQHLSLSFTVHTHKSSRAHVNMQTLKGLTI